MSFDPNNRELCPDGACIGVIGPDGRCNECGLPGPSTTPNPRYKGMNLDPADVGGSDGQDELGGSDGFDGRELCSDGACVGVIGPDGRCKECGAPGRSAGLDPRSRGMRDADEVDGELEAHIAERDLAGPPDDFDDRELCPDGACIGVIGPDGCCKECGAARASA